MRIVCVTFAVINKRLKIDIFCFFIAVFFQAFIVAPPAYSESSKNKHTYFLLVSSTYDNELAKIDIEKIKAINESPYDGVAMRVIWEFDDKPFDHNRVVQAGDFIRRNSNKSIWPWVFLNRMIGDDGFLNVKEVIRDKPYFRKIKGMDIYDETGALSDFYEIWRSSLRLAKKLGAPGIVFDIEAYNKYEVNKIDLLANKHKKNPEEIRKQLTLIGKRLTDISAEEYPGAIIWFLFTHLAEPIPSWYPQSEKKMSTSYVVEGMLKEAEKRKLPLKFISGGEVGLGYCHKTVEDLRNKIKIRNDRFKPILAEHKNLFLGGTIAPWNDKAQKKGWMTEKVCGEAGMKTMDDFVPFIRTLAKTYDYVWIYSTAMAGYNPFNPDSSKAFNEKLKTLIPKDQ